jgi:plastocyanin
VAILVGACGGGDDDVVAPPEPGCRVAEDGRVEIVARDLAWDTDCLEVPAGTPVVVAVDNRDDGVNHNLRLTGAPGDPGTDLEAGPVIQELDLELPVGDYDFVCDIHPTMVGVLHAGEQVTPSG